MEFDKYELIDIYCSLLTTVIENKKIDNERLQAETERLELLIDKIKPTLPGNGG